VRQPPWSGNEHLVIIGLIYYAKTSGKLQRHDTRDRQSRTPTKHLIVVIGENVSYDTWSTPYVPPLSHSVEHTKRYTTNGMATDQGKTSNVLALALLADALAKPISEVGTTTFRPPFTPVTFGALAGRDRGELSDPVRTTPIHPWHVGNGAVFEDVGQWKRPWYFPQPGEDMHAAVVRECKAVRTTAGVMDASTLGKIDIQGPDAAEFLNRIYTNTSLPA